MATVTYSNEEMNRFWLQIMGDNALVILNTLSSSEVEDVRQARALADRFDALKLRADENPTPEQTAQINREAFQTVQDFRRFVLQTAKKVLTEDFHLDLKPAVLNNFVNEAERYMDRLHTFMQNKTLTYDPVVEEIFWLPVFVQMSYYIANNVGYYQKENRERALELADILNEYWAFSVELQGMSRIGRDDFPMAREHHRAVLNVLNDYYEFLTSLVALQEQNRLPGSMSLLYMDRSRRIVCFFLKQMDEYFDFQAPDCDPFALRISSL